MGAGLIAQQVPRIPHFMDTEKKCLNVELFERELCVMSAGEVKMAEFFASVWFHNNGEYGFDLADAAAKIDVADLKIIITWLEDPFWQ